MTEIIMPDVKDVREFSNTDASIPGMTLPELKVNPMRLEDGRKLSDLTSEEKLDLLLGDFNQDFIPVPVGWRILIAPPVIDDVYAGTTIVKSDDTKKGERYQGSWGYLVAVGEGYNRHKVTGEPWKFANAAPGDTVIHGKWSGQVMRVTDDAGNKQFFHILNDDEILCICHPDAEVMTATPEMLNNLA